MSRFHFHLTSTHDLPDADGVELPSLQEARCYAVRMMAEVLCTSPERYWETEYYRVTATRRQRPDPVHGGDRLDRRRSGERTALLGRKAEPQAALPFLT
jgi:hypothetical protein